MLQLFAHGSEQHVEASFKQASTNSSELALPIVLIILGILIIAIVAASLLLRVPKK